jgi:hypothetical protein
MSSYNSVPDIIQSSVTLDIDGMEAKQNNLNFTYTNSSYGKKFNSNCLYILLSPKIGHHLKSVTIF